MNHPGKKRRRAGGWGPAGCLSLAVLLWSCGCGGSPAQTHRYLLEYPSPVVATGGPLDAALAIEPFEVNQAFNSTAMIYRPSPNVSNTYRYHRWRVDPGSMVTDFLLRDFRHARLFKAILPKDSAGDSRFRLEGGVEEIQEIDAPEGWQAALTLTVTLLDLKGPEVSQRVVFQKTFRALEPMPEKTPRGLAQAAGTAMQRLSQEIMSEVYRAAQQRLRAPGKI